MRQPERLWRGGRDSVSSVRVEQLTKRFGATVVLAAVNLTFEDGRVSCILGPSGCGKTTLLRVIAGLEAPTSGRILFDGLDVTRRSTRQRNVAMVFQSPVVYPDVTVAGNVALSLRGEHLRPTAVQERVRDALERLDLSAMADRPARLLDGVARQRVAVARAVARDARVLLFDEPLTALDAAARLELKRMFKELARDLHKTFVYVTHDQAEAMTLADRMFVMHGGNVMQQGSPAEIYARPQHVFVGWFLGNPGMNFVPARVTPGEERPRLECALFSRTLASGEEHLLASDGALQVGVRPEHLEVYPLAVDDAVAAQVVRAPRTVGGQQLLTLSLADVTLLAKVPPSSAFRAGDRVWVRALRERAVVFREDGGRVQVS